MKDLRKLAIKIVYKNLHRYIGSNQKREDIIDSDIIDSHIDFYKQASKDMYPKEFIRWIVSKKSPVVICHGDRKPFVTTNKDYTPDELFIYWKDNIQGK